MLYDPKWDQIYTIKGFAAWLSKQDPAQRYVFTDYNHCAAAQYLQSFGLDGRLDCDRLKELDWMPIVCGVCSGGNTFGAAAIRANNKLTYGTIDPSIFQRFRHWLKSRP